MAVADIQSKFQVNGRVLGTGPLESQAIAIQHVSERNFDNENPLLAAEVIAVKRFTYFAIGKTAGITPSTGASFTADAGTKQIERATVVAPSNVTANGEIAVTVAGIKNSVGALLPDQLIFVAVAIGNTPTIVAANIAAALNANPVVSAQYLASSVGAVIDLVSKFPKPNNTSLVFSWGSFLGISAMAASTNQAAGVGGVELENSGVSWPSAIEGLYVVPIVRSGAILMANYIGANGTYPSALEINPSCDVGLKIGINADMRFVSQSDEAVLDVLIIGR